MIFLMATGKIDPVSIRLNGDHALFALQTGPDRYRVKTIGLEQYRLVSEIQAGEAVFLLGTATGKKITVYPRLLLRLEQVNGQRERGLILEAARQIMEAHF